MQSRAGHEVSYAPRHEQVAWRRALGEGNGGVDAAAVDHWSGPRYLGNVEAEPDLCTHWSTQDGQGVADGRGRAVVHDHGLPVGSSGMARLGPVELQMGDEPGHQHGIPIALSGHLVGDV